VRARKRDRKLESRIVVIARGRSISIVCKLVAGAAQAGREKAFFFCFFCSERKNAMEAMGWMMPRWMHGRAMASGKGYLYQFRLRQKQKEGPAGCTKKKKGPTRTSRPLQKIALLWLRQPVYFPGMMQTVDPQGRGRKIRQDFQKRRQAARISSRKNRRKTKKKQKKKCERNVGWKRFSEKGTEEQADFTRDRPGPSEWEQQSGGGREGEFAAGR